MMLRYKPHLKKYAQALRKNMTDAERALWRHVRGKQLAGAQFYRQTPIENLIVDFFCPSSKLIIELDGGQHALPDSRMKDELRDSVLSQLGYRVMRFSDRDVLLNIQGVLEAILREIEVRRNKSPLSPP